MLFYLACTKTPAPGPEPEPPQPEVRGAVDAPGDWGALVWHDGQAWHLGGGKRLAVGPDAVGELTPRQGPKRCGGNPIAGAPPSGAVVLPPGSTTSPPPPPIAVPAVVVEKAGWRIDEALPPADRFTPKTPSQNVAHQRGVEVGSLAKMRRDGGPPWMLASGHRGCDAALVVMDHQAAEALVADRLSTCAPLRLLGPHDFDGDGKKEVVAFNDDTVAVYRIISQQTRPELHRLGQWSCRP